MSSYQAPTLESSRASGHTEQGKSGITEQAHGDIHRTYHELGAQAEVYPTDANALAVLNAFTIFNRGLGPAALSMPAKNLYKIANAIARVVPPQCPNDKDIRRLLEWAQARAEEYSI